MEEEDEADEDEEDAPAFWPSSKTSSSARSSSEELLERSMCFELLPLAAICFGDLYLSLESKVGEEV